MRSRRTRHREIRPRRSSSGRRSRRSTSSTTSPLALGSILAGPTFALAAHSVTPRCDATSRATEAIRRRAAELLLRAGAGPGRARRARRWLRRVAGPRGAESASSALPPLTPWLRCIRSVSLRLIPAACSGPTRRNAPPPAAHRLHPARRRPWSRIAPSRTRRTESRYVSALGRVPRSTGGPGLDPGPLAQPGWVGGNYVAEPAPAHPQS
jgi:hypothetical protein